MHKFVISLSDLDADIYKKFADFDIFWYTALRWSTMERATNFSFNRTVGLTVLEKFKYC